MTEPRRLDASADWVVADSGFDAQCAINEAGELFCEGDQTSGAVGVGEFEPTEVARPLTQIDGTDWVDVTSSFNHTCALKSDGTAWCWGLNRDGELGNGRAWFETPVPVLAP